MIEKFDDSYSQYLLNVFSISNFYVNKKKNKDILIKKYILLLIN